MMDLNCHIEQLKSEERHHLLRLYLSDSAPFAYLQFLWLIPDIARMLLLCSSMVMVDFRARNGFRE